LPYSPCGRLPPRRCQVCPVQQAAPWKLSKACSERCATMLRELLQLHTTHSLADQLIMARCCCCCCCCTYVQKCHHMPVSRMNWKAAIFPIAAGHRNGALMPCSPMTGQHDSMPYLAASYQLPRTSPQQQRHSRNMQGEPGAPSYWSTTLPQHRVHIQAHGRPSYSQQQTTLPTIHHTLLMPPRNGTASRTSTTTNGPHARGKAALQSRTGTQT
jgi:hypothetical protein